MNAKLVAIIFLCVFSMWKIVHSQKKCNNGDFCNLGDCGNQSRPGEDENKLDRACETSKCNFDFVWSIRSRVCFGPGKCTEGQYCSPDCQAIPNAPENVNCIVGFNCNRETLRCIKKPKCKDGEYCKRGDCEGDKKPTFPDDDACEDGSECNASFKCVKISTTTTSTADIEEKKGSKWWRWFIIGFFTCVVLVFGILGSLWFFLYYRKNKKNITKTKKPSVSTVKKGKEKKPRLSIVKEVKQKKPRISTVNEVEEVVKKPDSEVTARKSISSIPGKRKSKSSTVSRRLTRSSLIPSRKPSEALKGVGEW